MARSAFLWFFTESWGSKQGIRRSPKSCTRKEHESATNPIAKRGQGAMPLAGSRDSVPCGVWGNAPTVPRPTNPKEAWGESSLGARLRTRKVTGRDAALPAPLLAASLGLVGRGTVGALPQTPQGTLSLDPARGNFPLDPFSRLSWSRFHTPSACSFFCASPKPLFAPPNFR